MNASYGHQGEIRPWIEGNEHHKIRLGSYCCENTLSHVVLGPQPRNTNERGMYSVVSELRRQIHCSTRFNWIKTKEWSQDHSFLQNYLRPLGLLTSTSFGWPLGLDITFADVGCVTACAYVRGGTVVALTAGDSTSPDSSILPTMVMSPKIRWRWFNCQKEKKTF